VKRLTLRTTLSLAYTAILAVGLMVVGIAYHSLAVRLIDAEATAVLREKAGALHEHLRFDGGKPQLSYDPSDPEEVAFINDLTRYYQVYDAGTGSLLTQSPWMESLGLHYTPAEVGDMRARSEPYDVRTDRGRLRVVGTVVPAVAGRTYLVQVGEPLDGVDRALARTDELVFSMSLVGLLAALVLGRWMAGLALAPLARLAESTREVGIGRLSDRLPLRGVGDELDQIGHAFNDALGRIEQSVGEMRQFSASLAHELRTPLAVLRGEAELELAHPLSIEDRRDRLVSQIEEYDRLTRLIGQILTLARAGAGEIALTAKPVRLGAVAAAVAQQIEPVASAQGISLTCEADVALEVSGDEGWLGRLLLILLDNAIKYTDHGGRIEVRVSRDGEVAVLAVADDGIGIAPEALPRLFEPFYRVETGTIRQRPGAGLGLALAKWIVERHGGTITVSSAPGAGSTFTVRVAASPRTDGDGAPEAPRPAPVLLISRR